MYLKFVKTIQINVVKARRIDGFGLTSTNEKKEKREREREKRKEILYCPQARLLVMFICHVVWHYIHYGMHASL